MNFIKTKIKLLAVITFLTISFSACNKDSPDAKAPTEPAIETKSLQTITVETISPDLAVKSWWKLIDLGNLDYQKKCKAIEESNKSAITPFNQYGSKIVQGDVLKSLANTEKQRNCSKDNYEREIQEVKLESETRAIVYAKVKNSSPIPQGAVPTAEEIKSRENGQKFKYVVEKTSEGWKISQIYRSFDDLGPNEWTKLYSNEPPSYPNYVFMQ